MSSTGAYARCRASARWRTCSTFRGPKPACTRASGSPLVLQFAPGGLDRRALGDDELDTLPKDAFEERGVDVGRIGDRDLDPVLADEADGNREEPPRNLERQQTGDGWIDGLRREIDVGQVELLRE